jgi:hypothetical protein
MRRRRVVWPRIGVRTGRVDARWSGIGVGIIAVGVRWHVMGWVSIIWWGVNRMMCSRALGVLPGWF